MSKNEYLVIKPDLQYQSAPDSDISINTELKQTQSELIEYDRTVTVNLATLFDAERNKSNTFRPILKFSYVYDNNLVGSTKYQNFLNDLYYVDPEISSPLLGGNNSWSGLPSYEEFEFIRTDITNPQVSFVTKSASSYNWNVVMSYPIENNFTVPMKYYFEDGSALQDWKSGDGIPFYISAGSDNGLPILQFNCPVKHGLSELEYVQLSFDYNGTDTFQVFSLGNGNLGSEEYVFNLVNVGYTGTTFNTGNEGTFTRIIDINNSGETTSIYYVRIHKVITNPQDSLITRNGFESNPFSDLAAYQFSSLTPNNISRVAKWQSSNTYNMTLSRDLEINTQLDNNKKPLTQIFATFQNVGYFGWWNKLRRGWEFNMTPNQTNPWWDLTNGNAVETNQTSNYIRNIDGSTVCVNPADCYNFTVNLPRLSGDTLYGDWCEWNDTTQQERVISRYMNKLTYYTKAFDVTGEPTSNPNGYYYQVHYPITLKVFSDYIETASPDTVDGVPNYAYFSNTQKLWYWRDLYPFGFIDTNDNGVDYPFLNDAHYPFTNVVFRLYPEGASFDITEIYSVIPDPIIDGCE
jgi:hypothetical protein